LPRSGKPGKRVGASGVVEQRLGEVLLALEEDGSKAAAVESQRRRQPLRGKAKRKERTKEQQRRDGKSRSRVP